MPVLLPESLLAACDLMAEYGDGAVPVAGGTDLLRGWLSRPALHQRPLVDLSALGELRSLAWTDDELVIGALTPFATTARDPTVRREMPAIAAAAHAVEPLAVRLRATWGGNLATQGSGGDGAVALLATGARVELISRDGTRELPVAELLAAGRRPQELLRRVRVARRRAADARFLACPSGDWRHRPALALAPDDAGGWRVATAVGGRARRLTTIEALLAAGERDATRMTTAFAEELGAAGGAASGAVLARLLERLLDDSAAHRTGMAGAADALPSTP